MARRRTPRPSRSGGCFVTFGVIALLVTILAILWDARKNRNPAVKPVRAPAVAVAVPAEKPRAAEVPAHRAQAPEPKILVTRDVGGNEDADPEAGRKARERLEKIRSARGETPAIESVGVAPPPSKTIVVPAPAKAEPEAPNPPFAAGSVGAMPMDTERQILPYRVIVIVRGGDADGGYVDMDETPNRYSNFVDEALSCASTKLTRRVIDGRKTFSIAETDWMHSPYPDIVQPWRLFGGDVLNPLPNDPRREIPLTMLSGHRYARVWFETTEGGQLKFNKLPKLYPRLYEAGYARRTAYVQPRFVFCSSQKLADDGQTFWIPSWVACTYEREKGLIAVEFKGQTLEELRGAKYGGQTPYLADVRVEAVPPEKSLDVNEIGAHIQIKFPVTQLNQKTGKEEKVVKSTMTYFIVDRWIRFAGPSSQGSVVPPDSGKR